MGRQAMLHRSRTMDRSGPWFMLAAALAGAALAYDVAHNATVPMLADRPPLASPGFVLRDMCLAVSASAVVAGMARWRPRRAAALAHIGRVGDLVSRPLPMWVASVATAVAAGVLGVLVASRHGFSVLAMEDGVVEDLTAVLLLAPVPVLAVRAVVSARRRAVPAATLLAATALGLLVLGMEEISWGQRILDFGTPTALAASNTQGEANLHNIATDKLEILFYAGTALGGAGLALVRQRLGTVARRAPGALLPSVPVLLLLAPAAALNYDIWNVLPVQLGFWLTCAALARMASPDPMGLPHRRDRRLAATVLAVCVALQLALLATGGEMLRVWDATEYRELFTAAALAAYAWSLDPARIGERDDDADTVRPGRTLVSCDHGNADAGASVATR